MDLHVTDKLKMLIYFKVCFHVIAASVTYLEAQILLKFHQCASFTIKEVYK